MENIEYLNEKISVLEKKNEKLINQNIKNTNEILRIQRSFNSLLLSLNENNSLNNYYCPICKKYSVIFLPYGESIRSNAMCPHCGAVERHRLLYLYLKNLDILNRNIKLLHFAPESIFYNIFKNRENIDYYPTDIVPNQRTRLEMDMQNIPFEDNSFDIIYNSHVLEHVPDDFKAMKELYRVVKPVSPDGGKVIIMAPVFYSLSKTLEKEEYNTPELRSKYYGQADHLRRYGADFDDRLRSVGFDVEIVTDEDLVENKKDIKKMHIETGDKIYVCTKK